MQALTLERLKKAGWYEGRKIDISEMEEMYKKGKLPMPQNVKKFLEEFGNLRFEDKDRDDDISFVIDNLIGNPGFDYEYYYEILRDFDINITVYPIGIACRKNMIVIMDENNHFYYWTEYCLLRIGKNIDEMLDCKVGELSRGEYIINSDEMYYDLIDEKYIMK